MPLISQRHICENCQHWQPIEPVQIIDEEASLGAMAIRTKQSPDKWGLCKRYPPHQETSTYGSANFPATQSFNWCGEFKDTMR